MVTLSKGQLIHDLGWSLEASDFGMEDVTMEWSSSALDPNKERNQVWDKMREAEWSEKVKQETRKTDSWTDGAGALPLHGFLAPVLASPMTELHLAC